jgi:hypothetical protein
MSIRILCPNGHELIAELEHIGRKIRCPACKVVMVVPDPNPGVTARTRPRPVPGPPEPGGYDQPEPMEEEPRKQKGMKTRSRMRLANVGLGFHYAKIVCILVALVLTLVSSALIVFAASEGARGVRGVLSCLSLVLILATPLLGGTGSLLCFWLPSKSRSRVLVIVSFALEVGGAALTGIATIMTITGSAVAADEFGRGRGPGGGLAMAGTGLILILLGAVVIYASFIMFLVFLRAIASYLRDEATANEAMRQLILYLIVTIGGFVVLTGLTFALRGAGMGGLIVMFVLTLGWLVVICFVMFGILNVLGTIRQSIATRW